MSDLSELYQEVILDHNQRPRNFHALDGKARRADGHNPLCGDRLTLFLEVQEGVVKDVGFQGSGCAISKASASMMTDAVKGRTEEEAASLFRLFHDLVTGAVPADGADARLGKLVVFAGVRDYPVRVKCATLAWHTLRAALDNRGATASTE